MALPASDTFTTGADQVLTSYSANWTNNNNSFYVLAASDDVRPNASGQECGAHWNADTFNNDQYAQVVMNATYTDGFIGPAVRCAASGATYYHFYLGLSNSYMGKLVSGSWSQLGSTGAAGSAGSTYKLTAEGTTITPYQNGSVFASIGAQTDSSIASGYAGLSGFGNTVCRGDNWEGGDLGATTVLGAAQLSASGALTAAGLGIVLASSSLSAAGSLAAAALGIVPAAALLQGLGSLTSAGGIVIQGAALLSASSDITAAALVQVLGQAALSGSGDLASAALVQILAAALLSASGQIQAAGFVLISTTTPSERTFTVPADLRSFTIPAHQRSFTIPAENRTVTVPLP